MIIIAYATLITILWVILDKIESNWEERKWRNHDQLDSSATSNTQRADNTDAYRRSDRAH